MKHFLLALTLIAAVSCGDDDNDSVYVNPDDFKIVLNSSNPSVHICAIAFMTDDSSKPNQPISFTFTEETVDRNTRKVIKSERKSSTNMTSELEYVTTQWAVYSFTNGTNLDQHRAFKDVTFHNLKPTLDSTLIVSPCVYGDEMNVDLSAVTVTPKVKVNYLGLLGGDELLTEAGIEATAASYYLAWDGSHNVYGMGSAGPAVKKNVAINDGSQTALDEFTSDKPPKELLFGMDVIIKETVNSPRSIGKYGGVYTIDVDFASRPR